MGIKKKQGIKGTAREMTGKAQSLTKSVCPDSSILLIDTIYSEIVPLVLLCGFYIPGQCITVIFWMGKKPFFYKAGGDLKGPWERKM